MKRSRAVPVVVLLAAVVGGAVLQGLSATPGLGRMPGAAFAAMAVASAIVLIAQISAGAWAVHALFAPAEARPWGAVTVWAAIVVVATAGALVVFPPLGLAPLVVGAFAIPAAAAGSWNALRGLGTFRRSPWRSLLLVIGVLVACGVSFVVGAATGLFLTGTLGGIVAWLWFGSAGAALVVWSTWLRVRGR